MLLLSPLFSAVPPLLSAAVSSAKDYEFQMLGRGMREKIKSLPRAVCCFARRRFAESRGFPRARARLLQIPCRSSKTRPLGQA